jgi:hypothetical protein
MIEEGQLRLSDRVIFGLLGVAVFAPANSDQQVPAGYHLTFGEVELPINEWWGRAADFSSIVATEPMVSVRLDFGEWMQDIDYQPPRSGRPNQ